MAPVLDAPLTILYPWPLFQCVLDGEALIGGKLYSFQPSTSTPKSTWADPFFTSPNSNPVIMDSQGSAVIYLSGNYDLRLFTPDDILVWSVSDYTFSSGVTPSPGLIQVGSAEVTLDAVDGATVLTATGLAPVGYRLLGLTTRVLEEFGTSHGLSGLAFGDAVVLDRWGVQGTLTVGSQTTERDWHSDTQLLTAQPYDLLVSARGGPFDGNGQVRCRLVWQTLGDTVVPGADPTVITYGDAEQTLDAVDGALVLTATGLAPANCRLLGLTTTILETFGTSRGLSSIALGDGVVLDRWGETTALSAETTTNLKNAASDTQPIAPPGYTILVTSQGGAFSAQGSLQLRLYWSVLMPV